MKQDKRKKQERVSPDEMMALELELAQVKKEHGIKVKTTWWARLSDILTARSKGPKQVERKKYIRLALICGWFCGAHRFYAGQKLLGVLYLLFCWTGIPVAMTLIDLMIVIPMKPNEAGIITL